MSWLDQTGWKIKDYLSASLHRYSHTPAILGSRVLHHHMRASLAGIKSASPLQWWIGCGQLRTASVRESVVRYVGDGKLPQNGKGKTITTFSRQHSSVVLFPGSVVRKLNVTSERKSEILGWQILTSSSVKWQFLYQWNRGGRDGVAKHSTLIHSDVCQRW